MPDPSPWSPSAVRAALEAWEAHGQAGDSPEECMRAALTAALAGWETREELGICHFDGVPTVVHIRPLPRIYSPHISVWRRTVGQTPWVRVTEEVTRRA